MATSDNNAIIAGNAAGRIFGARVAAEHLGISVSTLKTDWPKGRFPAPIRISEGRVGWLESEILQWQRDRIAARDANLVVRNSASGTS